VKTSVKPPTSAWLLPFPTSWLTLQGDSEVYNYERSLLASPNPQPVGPIEYLVRKITATHGVPSVDGRILAEDDHFFFLVPYTHTTDGDFATLWNTARQRRYSTSAHLESRVIQCPDLYMVSADEQGHIFSAARFALYDFAEIHDPAGNPCPECAPVANVEMTCPPAGDVGKVCPPEYSVPLP
jgi:hypothetical protein